MSAGIEIKLDGDLAAFKKRLKKLSKIRKESMNEEIAEQLRTSTLERFRNTISPDGKKWQPSIRAAQTGGLTLTHKAMLKNSIKAQSDAEGLAVGTNTIYASTHQYGADRVIRPKKKKVLRFKIGDRWISKRSVRVIIPARPFLGISEEDMEEIKAIMEDALEE